MSSVGRVGSGGSAYMSFDSLMAGSNPFKKNYSDSSPASIMIGNRFLTNAGNTEMANGNVSNGVSYLKTADSGMQQIQDVVSRLKSLGVQASSDLLSSSDREAINTEAKQMLGQIDDWVSQSKYNGLNFLQGDQRTLAVGPDGGQFTIQSPDASRASLGIDNIDFSNMENSQNALSALDGALQITSDSRTLIGSQINSLQSIYDANQESQVNAMESGSKLTDADMAMQSSQWASAGVMSQASIMVQAQGQSINAQMMSSVMSGIS